MGLDLVAPWLALVGVKNSDGCRIAATVMASNVGAGNTVRSPTGWPHCRSSLAFFGALKYNGVVSLHSEYKGESSFRRMTTPELLVQSAADLRYVKSLVV